MILTIDYLILNFKGQLTINQNFKNTKYSQNFTNPFKLEQNEFGTKIFSESYNLIHENKLIAKVFAVPRSKIIDQDLIQIQFENYLFYTISNEGLKELVLALQEYYNMQFDSINRLDIAVDKMGGDNYKNVFNALFLGKLKVKGRPKNISVHNITNNGVIETTGYSFGKRSSSRFLRIYNKTKQNNDSKEPKEYINDWHKLNDLDGEIWRFEYQLNSSFFTYLEANGKKIDLNLFDYEILTSLLKFAEKNHFEFVENTNKSQNQKEKSYNVNNWEALNQFLKGKNIFLARIKKITDLSDNIKKRLIKGLFRQFYITKKRFYLKTMCQFINAENLKSWFIKKANFYLQEFEKKEKIKYTLEINSLENQLLKYLN